MKTVPLFNSTVKDRLEKMAADCQKQLHDKLRNPLPLSWMKRQVSNESVLLVYVQNVDGDE